MEIVEIIDVAKEKTGFKSDRKLAAAIGVTHPTLIRMRRGWGFPSEENMMKLGELAGIDRASALLLLNMWKAQGDAKSTYSDILRRLSAVAGCFLIVTILSFSSPANASAVSSVSTKICNDYEKILYIMENNISD